MIKGSVGSNAYQHIWADFDGIRKDTMEDGRASCAFFVSGILAMFNVIDKYHSIVPNVVEAMIKAGWQKVEAPKAGDVLVWDDKVVESGEPAVPHMGFYIGEEKAVSNSASSRAPAVHDYLFRDHEERQIIAIYRGKHLMPDDEKIVEESQKQV